MITLESNATDSASKNSTQDLVTQYHYLFFADFARAIHKNGII